MKCSPIILFLCFISLSLVQAVTYDYENCGKSTNLNGKRPTTMGKSMVLGGLHAEMNQVPWAVAIKKNGNPHCTGTLVSSKHVLSAAHCVGTHIGKYSLSKLKKMIEIQAGGVCTHIDERVGCTEDMLNQVYRIVNATLHFKYYSSKRQYIRDDIVLFELDRPVEYPAVPICLHSKHDFSNFIRETAMYHMGGYGHNPNGYERADARMEVVALGGENIKCKGKRGRPYKEKGEMCTYENEMKNVCAGDSGGGIYTIVDGRAFLRGVVSRGSKCEEMVADANTYHVQRNGDVFYIEKTILKGIGFTN